MYKSFSSRPVLLVVILLLVYSLLAMAGSWNCQYDGGKKGTVGLPNSLTIDLGTILWADGSSGKATNVKLPMNFDHYNGTVLAGTWTKEQIVTPSGNFVVKLTVRLAGNKSWGIWRSKRNVVKIEVRSGNADGDILKEKTLDVNVRSPKNYTIETDTISANLTSGNSNKYTIVIRFDKYDNDGNDDGWCGMVIRVEAD